MGKWVQLLRDISSVGVAILITYLQINYLIKRAKNEFNVNPFKAGKNLSDSKCYCSLKVDQETLDQQKSPNLIDNNYDIPLGNLEGPERPLLKKI